MLGSYPRVAQARGLRLGNWLIAMRGSVDRALEFHAAREVTPRFGCFHQYLALLYTMFP